MGHPVIRRPQATYTPLKRVPRPSSARAGLCHFFSPPAKPPEGHAFMHATPSLPPDRPELQRVLKNLAFVKGTASAVPYKPPKMCPALAAEVTLLDLPTPFSAPCLAAEVTFSDHRCLFQHPLQSRHPHAVPKGATFPPCPIIHSRFRDMRNAEHVRTGTEVSSQWHRGVEPMTTAPVLRHKPRFRSTRLHQKCAL